MQKVLWQFDADERCDARCREIAGEMMRLFGISMQEAIGRINQGWRQSEFRIDELFYHDLPERWARRIYWIENSFWWITGSEREELGLKPLMARPYVPSG